MYLARQRTRLGGCGCGGNCGGELVRMGALGLGQDMPALFDAPAAAEGVMPFDPSLPYVDRPGYAGNKGCAPGYFVQFMPWGDYSSTRVQIPGVIADSWVRCRLMATTTSQTIAQESGQLAAESWYAMTNTGAGGWLGDWLNQIGTAGKWALGVTAVLMGGAILLRVLPPRPRYA